MTHMTQEQKDEIAQQKYGKPYDELVGRCLLTFSAGVRMRCAAAVALPGTQLSTRAACARYIVIFLHSQCRTLLALTAAICSNLASSLR